MITKKKKQKQEKDTKIWKKKTYPTKECYQLSTRKAQNSNLQNPKEGSSSTNNTKGAHQQQHCKKKQ
jgi:hypothetical protein